MTNHKDIAKLVTGYHYYYLTFKDITGRNYYIKKHWDAKIYPDDRIVELSDYQRERELFIERAKKDKVVEAGSGKHPLPFKVKVEDIDFKSIIFKNYNPEYPARYFPEFD